VKEDDMGRARSTNEGEECIYYIVGKPEGKRPLGIPRSRWVDNIKIDPGEMEDIEFYNILISDLKHGEGTVDPHKRGRIRCFRQRDEKWILGT
jgi:hypothetical protein